MLAILLWCISIGAGIFLYLLYFPTLGKAWFLEGLALCLEERDTPWIASNSEAMESLLTGRHFKLHGGWTYSGYNFWGLAPSLFYSQSKLFAGFMRDYDKEAFQKLISELLHGQGLRPAIIEAYGIPVSEIWERFIAHLKSKAHS